MKKNKKIKFILIISVGLLCCFGFKNCSVNKIKILDNNIKLKWSETDNNKPFTLGTYLADEYGTGTISFRYTNQFVNNISKRYSGLANNQTNIQENAYYKYANLFFGYGGFDINELDNLINDYVENENSRGTLENAKFYYNILVTPSYNLKITYEPYLVGEYFNDRGQGTREERLSFEECYKLISSKDIFLQNFYGIASGGASIMRPDFVRYKLKMSINIQATDSFGNLLTGDNFKKNRPQDAVGKILPIPFRASFYWNAYNTIGNVREQKNNFIRQQDLNGSNLKELNYSFTTTILEDLAQQFLGLDVIRTWDSTLGVTTSDNINMGKSDRGSYQGHNQLNINISINTESLGSHSSYMEGDYNGYKRGLKEGQEQWDWTNFLKSIFSGIDSFLNVEILPHVKLWYFVGIPLVFGLLKWLLSWFR